MGLLGLALAATQGCSGSDDTSSTGAGGTGGSSAGGSGGAGPEPVCTEPTAAPCSDAVIQDLNFNTASAPGLIVDEPDGAGYASLVDASAGGFGNPTPDSFVYARFTDGGLVKVELGDEDSLDSMDWDIAFRRFVIRVNSGNSGPSCVTAGRVPPADNDYDALGAVPAAMAFHADEYYSAEPGCEMVPDSFGMGTPQTVISSFWEYDGCVKMSGNVYVIGLADGRFVKLLVTAYYYDAAAADPEALQEQCDTLGTAPASETAAHIHFRWAFLP